MRASLLAAAAFAAGCAHSHYERQTAPAEEITWTYQTMPSAYVRAGLKANLDGRQVAQAPGWAGLPDAVRCVPTALDHARRARNSSTVGSVVATIGVGGIVAGLGLAFTAHDTDDLLAAVGGIGAGAGLMIGGAFPILGAQARAIDAVNVYNDRYAVTPGCAGVAAR